MLRCGELLTRVLLLPLLPGFAAGLSAQNQVLDVVDGETLYRGGWLVSTSFDVDREESLWAGNRRVDDPDAQHRTRTATTIACQYGLRHDVQLGIAAPFVDDDYASADGGSRTGGVGDVELLAKWRFHRWDAPRVAINTALITSLSLPTGANDERSNGVELTPERQPGSGGLDPAIGVAITPEPGRWRFNAAVLRQFRTDTDGDGDRLGSSWYGELAVGNRFWLEPYPGPFMRLDAFTHFYHEARDRQDGAFVPSTGTKRLAVGGTWAFRPRPSLDFQLSGEYVVWRDADVEPGLGNGQLDDAWSLQFVIGYRF
ncbi:MAG: transporter [Planctomycetes bacterium]|nr:transporter [Planctomycetota bacterium]